MAKWGLRRGCSSSSISGTPSAESVPRRMRPPLVLKKKISKTTVPRRRSDPAVVPQRQPKISPSHSPPPTGKAGWMEFVGPVTETREEHLRRHGGGLRSCPRCKWYRLSSSWLCTYGSRVRASAGARGRVCWLQERPERWGGAWALGCLFCAHRADRASMQASQTPASTRRRNQLATKWCRFEVCPRTLQAEHIKQHAHYDVHKLAERAYYQPDSPLTLTLQASEEDEALLAGAVPQPTDWLRAWQAVRSHQSWREAVSNAGVENFAHQINNRRPPQSRGLKHMAEIMQEVIRDQKRQWIRQSSSIALSFDDRQSYTLIPFRCDAPFSCCNADAGVATSKESAWREGIVGCTDCLVGTTLSDLAQDYAMRIVDQIVKQVRVFCGDDEELYAKFTRTVRIVVADGALQKVGQYMRKTHFPNIVLITRDPAHMVRVATRDPLLRTGRFEEQHKRLFTDRHALFKELQYSDLWQARLQDCQRIVLGRPNPTPDTDAEGGAVAAAHGADALAATQGGGLRHVLRHFSHAPQRFESWADPMRKYACTLNAVALLLADVAGDERQRKEKRDMAQKCLDAMTPRDLWETGLVGDFGEISMRSVDDTRRPQNCHQKTTSCHRIATSCQRMATTLPHHMTTRCQQRRRYARCLPTAAAPHSQVHSRMGRLQPRSSRRGGLPGSIREEIENPVRGRIHHVRLRQCCNA